MRISVYNNIDYTLVYNSIKTISSNFIDHGYMFFG